MKLSKYCLSYKDSSQPTLFNALTKEDIVIDNELFTALKEKAFHELGVDVRGELMDSGVLVDDAPEDERLAGALLSSFPESDEVLEITYAMTFSCNMSCSYCVQSGLPPEEECSDDEIVSGLLNILDRKKPKVLHLSFFGGEPMLRKDKIFGISSALRDGCAGRGITFSFGITTNGTLLRAADMLHLHSLGLMEIDVTLDGDRDVHDGRRVYHDGRGSFNDIVENIKELGGNVPVNLICNISGESEPQGRFLEFLAGIREEIQLKSIRFKPFFTRINRDACFYHDSHAGILKSVWDEAARYSLPVDKGIVIGPCGFFCDNSLAVSPSGKVYPCTPFYGDDKRLLGSLSGFNPIEKKPSFMDNLPRRCLECVYVPICGGGCRFVSLRMRGDVAKATCEKSFFDNIFDTL